MTNKLLKLTRFGNPILRSKTDLLSKQDISSRQIQELIANIKYTNQQKKYGVGLAAPQVGESKRLSIISIKATPTRPDVQPYESVIINPKYTGIGRRSGMWEGCQSTAAGKNTMYAKALRYKKINAVWLDDKGKKHDEYLEGLISHVFQHETDHLDGILFVDRVRDTKTYMLADEYQKRVRKSKNKKTT